MTHSSYLADIHQTLPRILGLFDTNPISAMRGVGDRYRWAWKGSDFANGTFQGAVHGLALLVVNGMLPEGMNEASILHRIHDALDGIRRITRNNGSLDEILPMESSYCVTALVAFDALCALDILAGRISDAERIRHHATVAPLIGFLVRARETHGIITNHLAVAAAALTRWHKMTGEDVIAARDDVLRVITRHYNAEGWFCEYEGADPGYQTLALDYLADMDAQAPELGLASSLFKTCEFLGYCAHPDGSFGGLYGSRNTRFLYPAGIGMLARQSPHAAALASFAGKAHQDKTVVGLAAMDDSNLVPMFNSFCRAAALAQQQAVPAPLPYEGNDFYKEFPEAGLIVVKQAETYSIVNWRKSVLSHFSPGRAILDGGACARNPKNTWYTSQMGRDVTRLIHADAQQVVIEAPMIRYHVSYPAPVQMVVLRILCLSVMRIAPLNAWVKKILVRLLISRRAVSGHVIRRTITLHPEVAIRDEWISNPGRLTLERPFQYFQATHMASQGYWQRGDDA